MISTHIAYTDAPRIFSSPEAVFVAADALKQDTATSNFPGTAPAGKDALILLDSLRRAQAVTQDSSFPVADKCSATVRDNLKALIGLAENELAGSGPALGVAGITGFKALPVSKPMAPVHDLQQSKSAGLGAIGDRLAAAGQHTEAVMLYMAADMNLPEQTDMRYVVSAGKSLLALGRTEQAEEAFLLALQSTQSRIHSRPPLNDGNRFIAVDEPNFDIDYLLSELGKLQHETSQTRVASQQSAIKGNRDSREAQIKQKLEAMEATSKAKAEHDAAAKKAGFWSKISMILSVATAVIGIALAPLTGGLSMIGTALLVADLALELGEYFTGIEMSLQTNLQKVCVLIVDEILKGLGDTVLKMAGIGLKEAHQLCAAVLAVVINVVLMVVFMKMSMGKAVSNLAKAATIAKEGKTISKTKQVTNYLAKVGPKRIMQATTLSGALTSIYGGWCAYEAAVAGLELNSSEVQQTDIEKRQVKLDKLFEQLSDDLKLVAKELQRDMELLAEVLSGNIENRQKTITGLFHRPHLAA